MKKLLLLATAALVAMLILVPPALAQEMTVTQESTVVGEPLPASGGQTQPLPASGGQTQPLPASGGLTASSVLLPAAALLLGSGVVAYALVRRR